MHTPTRDNADELAARFVQSEPRGEWLRLPPPGERHPDYGLTRGTLNELILPREENDYKPPVHSIVIKRRGAVRGIRLIHRPSLDAYLARLAEEQATP
jgi:hypothetical protein